MAIEGDGSKIYVSCIAFRDPVCEDIAEAYCIPVNSYADKCICLVSRSPSFQILRDALEEIFVLCFSSSGSRYGFRASLFMLQLWTVDTYIAHQFFMIKVHTLYLDLPESLQPVSY